MKKELPTGIRSVANDREMKTIYWNDGGESVFNVVTGECLVRMPDNRYAPADIEHRSLCMKAVLIQKRNCQ